MAIKSKNIILSADIDYGYEMRNKGIHLKRGSKDFEIKAEMVEKVAKNVISHDLPNEMQDIFGLPIKTKIIAVRDGSILIFFQVVLGAFTFISSYKGFFDSINLIKSQCQRLLRHRLKDEFGEEFDISISEEYPVIPELPYNYLYKLFGRKFPFEPELFSEFIFGTSVQKKRDGFFYYLIIFNIVLLILIGILVYAAVVKTYFP